MKGLPKESGIVLVMVLWVLALLSTIAAQFALSTRAENQVSINLKESVQSYYLARAGMLQTIDRLSKTFRWEDLSTPGDPLTEVCMAWNRFSRPCRLSGEDRYRVMLEDETTKINVNDDYSSRWLDLLLKSVDIDQETRSTILDSLADWRDQDNLTRLHGAEEDYYRQLDNPYHCKNRDLDTVEELLLIKGMDRSILYGGERNGKVYNGIARFLTALPPASGAGTNKAETTINLARTNVNSCPLEMLQVFLDLTPEIIENIQTKRDKQGYLSSADLVEITGAHAGQGILPYITFAFPDTIKITVLGLTTGNNSGSAISAVIRFALNRRQFEILEWYDVVDGTHHGAASISGKN